jgi:hypothetical protein
VPDRHIPLVRAGLSPVVLAVLVAVVLARLLVALVTHRAPFHHKEAVAADQIILLQTMVLGAEAALLLQVLPEHQRLAVTVARELRRLFPVRLLLTLVAVAVVLLPVAQ